MSAKTFVVDDCLKWWFKHHNKTADLNRTSHNCKKKYRWTWQWLLVTSHHLFLMPSVAAGALSNDKGASPWLSLLPGSKFLSGTIQWYESPINMFILFIIMILWWYCEDMFMTLSIIMIFSWHYHDLMVILWWYYDDIMMIFWWHYDDMMMIFWWYYADIMMTLWLYYDIMMILWWYYNDIMMLLWCYYDDTMMMS